MGIAGFGANIADNSAGLRATVSGPARRVRWLSSDVQVRPLWQAEPAAEAVSGRGPLGNFSRTLGPMVRLLALVSLMLCCELTVFGTVGSAVDRVSSMHLQRNVARESPDEDSLEASQDAAQRKPASPQAAPVK